MPSKELYRLPDTFSTIIAGLKALTELTLQVDVFVKYVWLLFLIYYMTLQNI